MLAIVSVAVSVAVSAAVSLAISLPAPHQTRLPEMDQFAVPFDVKRPSLSGLPAGLAVPASLNVSVTKQLPASNGQGTLVHLQQRVAGLRVRGATGVAEVNANGQLHSLTHRFAEVNERDLPQASLDGFAATALAYSKVGGGAVVSPVKAELVVLAGAQVRLAYEVNVVSWLHPEVPLLVTVDATTGNILSKKDLRQTATFPASVYNSNPVENSTRLNVTLTSEASALKNTFVETRGCKGNDVDDVTFLVTPLDASMKATIESYIGKSFDYGVVPLCGEVATAVPADANTYEPANGYDDKFSEVNFFYHADKVARYFATNFPGYSGRPRLPGTVNFRTPNQFTALCTSERYAGPAPTGLNNAAVQAAARAAYADRTNGDITYFTQSLCSSLSSSENPTAGDWSDFANAFFMPALDPDLLPDAYATFGLLRDYDSMVFGQSGNYDFAYDGNVVYHEFMHSVVKDVQALQDGTSLTEFGPDNAPGAMNEGISDYFAAVLTNDPCVGEYLMGAMGQGECLRDLAATGHRCPESIVGQVHSDSQPFSIALWTAREAFGGQKETFDRAVFAALRRAGPQPTFADFASYLAEEVSSAGLSVDTLNTALDTTNVRACEYVIALSEKEESATIALPGKQADAGDFMPGYMQYKIEVPPLTKSIEVSFNVEEQQGGITDLLGGEPEPFEMEVYVQKADRISFGRSYTAPSGAVKASYSGKAPYREELELNDRQGGTYYVLLANTTASSRSITAVSWEVRDELKPEPVASTTGSSTGGTTGTKSQGDPLLSGSSGKKSGCSATDGSTSSSQTMVYGAIVMIVVARMLRRKRGGSANRSNN